MTLTPEREVPSVVERPDEFPDVPVEIEHKTALTPTPVAFTAQVKDEKGKPLILTPENENNKIEIPKSQEILEQDRKGSIGEALTWFGAFWLRVVKKALFAGKSVFVKN